MSKPRKVTGSITEEDIFSEEHLSKIFKGEMANQDHIISRESTWIEFKEAFDWKSKSKYGKTCAAFANAQGGYLIFGVSNNPRKLKGLSDDRFRNIDEARITEFFNETFSPTIKWTSKITDVRGKTVGILYIYECDNKPVISRKNSGEDIKEGEIYYRYRGQTRKIRYPELRDIIDEHRQKESQRWMSVFKQISKVGVQNAAILDTIGGSVTGPGGTFLIDEGTLDKIKFIREGEFNEKEGAPALRLVGDVEPIRADLIQPTRNIPTPVAIRTEEIIHKFLNQEQVTNPKQYITQICWESSAFLPVYYYMKLSSLSKTQAIDLIRQENSRQKSKAKLLERLSGNEDFKTLHRNTGSKAYRLKDKYRRHIINEDIPEEIPEDELRYFLDSIRTLDKREINTEYLFPILKKLYDDKYSTSPSVVTDSMRRAICHLDNIFFGGADDE